MPIFFKQGNIFESKSDIIVNPVNCVGVMGKGLALQFKNNFPRNFVLYKEVCNKGKLKPGSIFVTGYYIGKIPYYIVNFSTKGHWSLPSKIEYIKDGLDTLVKYLKNPPVGMRPVNTISIPKLGCGLGGLKWNDVYPLIIAAFVPLDIIIHIYGKEI